MGTPITKPLTEAQKKAFFAAKYKEVTLDLQKFFDGLGELCEDDACETLLCVQTDCADAYEELTGKSVF